MQQLSGLIHLYLQDERHAFVLAGELPADLNVQELILTDLNADGLADLYVGDWGSGVDSEGQFFPGRSVVWLGEGAARFRPSAPIDAHGRRHRLIDVSGDGALDLVTPGALRLGQGDGTFGPAQPLPTSEASDLAAADFDGDGRLDLAYNDFTGLWVLPGYGTGFGTPVALRGPLSSTLLLAAQLSGSPLPDLVALSSRYLDSVPVDELVVLTNQTATCHP